MGEAGDRLRQLAEHIGVGDLVGYVEVDQVYAAYQHEHAEFKHPQGGQPFYLQEPLYEETDRYMQAVADDMLDLDKRLADTVMDQMENLTLHVFVRAPHEFGNLAESGHPWVTDKGVIVRDRPPVQARLTEAELRALGKLRNPHHPYGHRGAHF